MVWLIGAGLVAVTVILHSSGTSLLVMMMANYQDWLVRQLRRNWRFPIMVPIALWLLLIHTIEIMIWAIAYFLLKHKVDFESFNDALYFSAVTYTTLGYGDLTISGEWRLLSGMEAMNGIFLCGWSSALLFVVVQQIWLTERHR